MSAQSLSFKMCLIQQKKVVQENTKIEKKVLTSRNLLKETEKEKQDYFCSGKVRQLSQLYSTWNTDRSEFSVFIIQPPLEL
jgi:hypothetical protein